MPFQPIAAHHFGTPGTSPYKTLSRFQSQRFVFVVRVSGDSLKVFQVIFSDSDGSIFVNLPYTSIKHGIVSEGSLPRNVPDAQVHLDQRGKVTSKLVKYAHHPDGRAHFSQAGKVRTEIARKSVPLKQARGHLFTLQVQGMTQFAKEKAPAPPPSRKRTVLTFDFPTYSPLALKFTGWWYHVRELAARTNPGPVGPTVITQKPNGVRQQSFLVGPLLGKPMADYALVVSCAARPFLSTSEPLLLNFIAGFGSASALDPLNDMSFLCASYPVSDHDSLAQRIGSIDLGEQDPKTNAA